MFKVRKAQQEDCRSIFEIRNDPEVLHFSFNSKPVSYEEHKHWFAQTLSDPSRLLLVIMVQNEFSGSLRYDFNKEFTEATISIYVGKDWWGKGVASFALSEGEKIAVSLHPKLKKLIAKVFAENTSSQRLFEKNEFTKDVIEYSKEVL